MNSPWMTEPKTHEWKTSVGLKAFARRHSEGLHWCVYVEVPPNHPVYRMGLEQIRAHSTLSEICYYKQNLPEEWRAVANTFDTVSYADEFYDGHGTWVLGADFAHSGQKAPGYNSYGRYVTMPEAVEHAEAMAKSIAKFLVPATCSKAGKPKRGRFRPLDRSKCKKISRWERCFFDEEDLEYLKTSDCVRPSLRWGFYHYVARCSGIELTPCTATPHESIGKCPPKKLDEAEGNLPEKGKMCGKHRTNKHGDHSCYDKSSYSECALDQRCCEPGEPCITAPPVEAAA